MSNSDLHEPWCPLPGGHHGTCDDVIRPYGTPERAYAKPTPERVSFGFARMKDHTELVVIDQEGRRLFGLKLDGPGELYALACGNRADVGAELKVYNRLKPEHRKQWFSCNKPGCTAPDQYRPSGSPCVKCGTPLTKHAKPIVAGGE